MKLNFIFIFGLLSVLLFSQDPREFNHGTCITEYTNMDNLTSYYLTWSSAYNDGWEHDIFNSNIYFNTNGDLIISKLNQRYIGSGDDEAQEPVNTTINVRNNVMLSVWEDGIDHNGPNVRGQLHDKDGIVIRDNWIIAGGSGSQHSANVAHLADNYVVFYADEAPPSLGGAVLKAKVINDITGDEEQTISFTPNNEDHWWPVSVSNESNTRTLIVWGNDGYAARGGILYDNNGTIELVKTPEDYLVNTQQYFYQVEWLENISKFLLIARDGAYENITNLSQICLIDTLGNVTNSTLVNGGILRESKMAVKWNDCNQSYSVLYPSQTNELTMVNIDSEGIISNTSTQIIGNSTLSNIEWVSTGIWAQFVTDEDGNDLFNNEYIALFVMNDTESNDIIKIAIHLDRSLFCDPVNNSDKIVKRGIVFPNPSSGQITISNTPPLSNYEVYSKEGISVIKGNTTTESIDLSILKHGIYYIRVEKPGSITQQFYRIVLLK